MFVSLGQFCTEVYRLLGSAQTQESNPKPLDTASSEPGEQPHPFSSSLKTRASVSPLKLETLTKEAVDATLPSPLKDQLQSLFSSASQFSQNTLPTPTKQRLIRQFGSQIRNDQISPQLEEAIMRFVLKEFFVRAVRAGDPDTVQHILVHPFRPSPNTIEQATTYCAVVGFPSVGSFHSSYDTLDTAASPSPVSDVSRKTPKNPPITRLEGITRIKGMLKTSETHASVTRIH